MAKILVLAAGFAVLSFAPDLNAQIYTITDLGVLPDGGGSFAYAINNKGQIVGYSTNFFTRFERAILWENGRLQDVSSGVPAQSHGVDINERGDVLVRSFGNGPEQAWLWQNGVSSRLNGQPTNYRPSAFNESGEAIGTSYASFPSPTQALIVKGGTWIHSGLREGYAINDRGEVAGAIGGVGISFHAGYRTREGQVIPLYSYSSSSAALAINNQSQVVGFSYLRQYDDTEYHAILWENGMYRDLGTLGGKTSSASAINDIGQIVGTSRIGTNASRAFLFYEGKMLDLNSLVLNGSQWELVEARDINDAGQIVGYGIFGGASRAFLLNPAPKVHPDRGGNTGPVSVLITLPNIQTGTAVRLTGIGADILGSNVTITPYQNSTVLRATFDLRSASVGARNIVLSPPSGSSITLINAFTILQGGSPQVWTDVIGFNRISTAREPTFHIMYGNRGIVNESPGKLWVSFSANLNLASTFTQQPSVVGQRGNTKYVAFEIRDLAPEFVGVIPVRLSAAGAAIGASFEIRAWKQ